MSEELLPCPFCGEVPELPHGWGTQYEMYCECGCAMASVQISDLMTIDERIADTFDDHRYGDEYIQRAKEYVINQWNTRIKS